MRRGKKLGEGTFGIVYSASSPQTNTQYAIKRNLVEEETSFIGVPREVDILSKLRKHPHIVTLEKVSFGEPFEAKCFSPLVPSVRKFQRDDSIHFVFKLAEYDLHTFIYGAQTVCFPLIKRYMVNILLGVEYMMSHSIIHRDLKPANILIFGAEPDAMNVQNVAKICDFGLAKPYTYQGIQTPGTVTAWYRAPEIALGYPSYDYKSDIWSIGCIFFEMVAKRGFISDVADDNDEIISRILGALPEQLPTRKFRELVRSNKWRKVALKPSHSPKTRKSLSTQLALSSAGLAQFESEAGSFVAFCDLLHRMLTFDWEARIDVKQCLSHPFFDDCRDLIAATRERFPPGQEEQYIIIRDSMERKWMAQTAIEVFNNRDELKWYTHRALFQAMDLFDRYMSVMFHHTPITPDMLESEYKGYIHDKFGAELRFVACLYLCIKYFSSIHYPVSYDSVVADVYKTPAAKAVVEQFETAFISGCLEYKIYRPTVYEAPDEFRDILDETAIRDLLILYSMNNSFSGMTHNEVYKYYRDNLRNKSYDEITTAVLKVQ